ncbi:hypothetical protein P5673_027208 [Acropora cervicornis]|uniref:Uncharacterized protein n=1 Tax=Acropora cervicornis TaxID=6130 RepID=A0AAD9PZ97_ACRCE|nr:hypothetical protein P5673_027208 [Acropora cervicornis]
MNLYDSAIFLTNTLGMKVVGVATASTENEMLAFSFERIIEPPWKISHTWARSFGKTADITS